MDKKIISDINLKNFFLDTQKDKYKNIIDVNENINCLNKNIIDTEQYNSILNDVNQLFLHHFQKNLSKFINIEDMIFRCTNIKNISYQDYIKNFNMPIKFNILESFSNNNIAFIGFSSQFIFFVIDLLFGNTGLLPPFVLKKNEFTSYEYNLIKKIYLIIIQSYVFSWKKIYSIDLKYSSIDNMYVNTDIVGCKDNNNLFFSEFSVNSNNSDIKFNICISSSIIQTWNNKLFNHKKLSDDLNGDINYDLLNIINKIELDIKIQFLEFMIPLSNILKLKIGDVFNISQPDQVIAHIDDMFLFSGKYGSCEGKHALSIINIKQSNIENSIIKG
ncbi:Flagellar motor switch protein FliM [Buchnera aphidicola (Eriosoma grossulariae)]|uniref:FliM/FliN family flagellar motor switch protein n=1 Tax=Buchnera aphidicola TaxID=9 RepID=UPI003463F92D